MQHLKWAVHIHVQRTRLRKVCGRCDLQRHSRNVMHLLNGQPLSMLKLAHERAAQGRRFEREAGCICRATGVAPGVAQAAADA
eukprot:12442165-Alexandrium_andersonii.AAC.1